VNTISIAINLPTDCGYDPYAYVRALVEAQTFQASCGNAIAAASLGNLVAMVSQSIHGGTPSWGLRPTG
jgi:hypothetical protein